MESEEKSGRTGGKRMEEEERERERGRGCDEDGTSRVERQSRARVGVGGTETDYISPFLRPPLFPLASLN